MGVVAEHRTEIDGIVYTTETFPGAQGLDMIQWLIKLLGPGAIELLMSVGDAEASALSVEPEVVAAIISGASERAEPGEFSKLCQALLVRTRFAPAPGQEPVAVPLFFDEHFAGRYMQLMEVCVWVVRVSFARP